ncbi:polyphenol oxidase family protein [Patescibacteria group bacterium]|nr:polyphenol oxidase family protein [Patescibacteria group bacterium]
MEGRIQTEELELDDELAYSPTLKELNIPHGCSTWLFGDMRGHSDIDVFYRQTGLDRNNRIHIDSQLGSHVIMDDDRTGESLPQAEYPECDAVVTWVRGRTLSCLVADAFPVVLISEEQDRLALMTVGRQNVHSIIRSTVRRLQQSRIRFSLDSLTAYIGPGIHPESYRDFRLVWHLWFKFPEWRKHLYRLFSPKPKIDLLGYLIEELLMIGISESLIVETQEDTVTATYSHGRTPLFFSERAGRSGRFIFAVALPDDSSDNRAEKLAVDAVPVQ